MVYLFFSFLGWILSYSNTSPYNITEPCGLTFLLTNTAYFATGIYGIFQGYNLQSVLLELAGLLSVNYHYKQLIYGRDDIEVKKALALDYFGAVTALLLIGYDVITQVLLGYPPIVAITYSAVGAICLLFSWVFARGLPYLLWHGLWHIFSGAACYELYSHLSSINIT